MSEDHSKEPNVAAILEGIREEVRRRRAALPAQATPAFPEIELRRTLQEIEAGRAVSTHWPLQARTLPQRGMALINRLVRRYLRWYINPIVEQQNVYNDVVARALHGLVAANDELRAEVAQLRARLQQRDPAETEDRGART